MEQGWGSVMATTLAEYAQSLDQRSSTPGLRHYDSWQELRNMPVIKQLVPLSLQLQKLLHAVDTFPRGGLCQGEQLSEALRRYESLWLPLLARERAASGAAAADALVPPLDVAFLWHLHRLQPGSYAEDTAKLAGGSPLHVGPGQAFAFTDGSDAPGAATARIWMATYPEEPFYPPAGAPSSSSSKAGAFSSTLSTDVLAVAVRQPLLTHQLLRQSYLEAAFLQRAADRYAKFLVLRKHRLDLGHPVPTADVALMWHTHMSCSAAYAGDCMAVLGRLFEDMPHGQATAYADHAEPGAWRFHWSETRRAWQEAFKEPYLLPDTGYVPIDSFHPAQLSLRSYLGTFEDSATAAAGGSWRAGAQALYVSWLQYPCCGAPAKPHVTQQQQQQQQQPMPAQVAPRPKKSSGGFFACCFGGSDVQESNYGQQHAAAQEAAPPRVQQLDAAGLQQAVGGFPQFRNLPHSCYHPYWKLFYARVNGAAPATVPQEDGPEIELLVAAPVSPSSRQQQGAVYDPDGNSNGFESSQGTSVALMWS